MAWISSGSVAMLDAFQVLWMTSRFHITDSMAASLLQHRAQANTPAGQYWLNPVIDDNKSKNPRVLCARSPVYNAPLPCCGVVIATLTKFTHISGKYVNRG